METTTFLAQLWGPTILAVGVGIFVSKKHYLKVYRELEKETLAVLSFGMVGIAVGVAQILYHNTWGSFPEAVVSLLGWMLLVKGLAMAISPDLVDRGGDLQAKSGIMNFGGLLMLVLGAYLCWFGFFM